MFPDPIIWEARGLDAEFLSTLSPSLQNLILDEAAHAAGADNPDQFLHHYPAGKVRTCFLLDIVLTRLNREVDALREEREERREDMMLESLELNDVVLANPRAGSFPAYDDNPNPENFTTLLASKEEIASNLLPTYTHYLNSSGTHYLSYSDAPVYDSVQIKHKDGTNVKVEEIQEWVAKWWEGAPNVSTIGK